MKRKQILPLYSTILPLYSTIGLGCGDGLYAGTGKAFIPKPCEPEPVDYARRSFLRTGIKAALAASLAPWIAHAQASFRLQQAIASAGVAATSGASCPADGSPSVSTTGSTTLCYLSFDNTAFYSGQTIWNDGGTARTICKLGFKLSLSGGSVTGKTYTAYIFSSAAGGDITPASPLATSNTVAGSDSWSDTLVRFTFPTPYTTAGNAGTLYALCLGVSGGADASNYITPKRTTTDQTTGSMAYFSNTGVAARDDDFDAVIEIYWQ